MNLLRFEGGKSLGGVCHFISRIILRQIMEVQEISHEYILLGLVVGVDLRPGKLALQSHRVSHEIMWVLAVLNAGRFIQ